MFGIKSRKAAKNRAEAVQRLERERAAVEAKLLEEKAEREAEKLAAQEAREKRRTAKLEEQEAKALELAVIEKQNAEHESFIAELTQRYSQHPVTRKIADNFVEYVKNIESRYCVGNKKYARVTIYANFTCRAFVFEAERCVYDDYGEVSIPERVGDTLSTTFYSLGIKNLASGDDVIALCRAVISLIDYHPENTQVTGCLRLGKAYEQYRQSVVFDFTNPPALSKEDLMDW